MKKLLALLLAVVMLLSLMACGNNSDDDDEDEDDDHTHRYSETVVEPSCTEEGYTLQTCKCGKTRKRDRVPALGHDFVNNVCAVCGAVDGEPSVTIPSGGDLVEQNLAYDGSPVTITFYHTMGGNLQGILNTYIEEFNQLYPNITIEHQSGGTYNDLRDLIKTEIAIGNQPNLAYCYGDHVALYNSVGAVTTLDDLMNSTAGCLQADGTIEILGLTDYEESDLISSFLEEGRQFGDGLTYMMPLSKSTEVLYYNLEFFNQYSLDVPTTWDELWEVCAQIKAIDPDCIPLGYDSEANWFINYCLQSGTPYTSTDSNHYLFNNDTNQEFILSLRDNYSEGYFTTQSMCGSYTSNLFVERNCYMCIGSTGGASYHQGDFEVGIANVPQVNPYDPKVITQGPNLCIFNSEDPQEVIASWLFVKFLCTNTEFQAEFSANSGFMPVIHSVLENPFYQTFLESNYIIQNTLRHCLANTDAYCTTPVFNGSAHARDIVGELLTAGCSVDCDIDLLFSNAIEACVWGDDLEVPEPAEPDEPTRYCMYNPGSGTYVSSQVGYYTNGKSALIMSAYSSDACEFEIIHKGDSVAFRTSWGEYLCCDGSNVYLMSSNNGIPDEALFILENSGSCYTIQSKYGVYDNGTTKKVQYLDVYGGGLACYGWQSDSVWQYEFELIETN